MSNQPDGTGVDFSTIADTATRLKAAAVYLFAHRGYHGTSIRDIAGLTGVTNAAVYHFVANKEALLLDIMREGQSLLLAATRDGLERAHTPADRLATLVAGLAGAHGKNRLLSFVTDGEIRSLTRGSEGLAEIVRLRDEYERMWIDVIREGAASGQFTVHNERLARLALITMSTGVSSWYRASGHNTLEEIITELVNYALAAVGATDNGRPLTSSDVVTPHISDMPLAAWEPQTSTPEVPIAQ